MRTRRFHAGVCLLSFLSGLLFSSSLMAGGGGDRFHNYQSPYFESYVQQRTGSVLPAVIGGVTGAAIGGATFGPVGALAGAAGGFAIGRAIGNKYAPGEPLGFPQRVNSSFLVNFIPGLAGAVLGAVLVSGIGPLAMAVGGITGFFVGKALARMIFPQLYYGGSFFPTRRTYITRVRQAPVYNRRSNAPAAPVSDLESLKTAFYASMHNYREALVGGCRAEKQAARRRYLRAQELYFNAKNAVLQK